MIETYAKDMTIMKNVSIDMKWMKKKSFQKLEKHAPTLKKKVVELFATEASISAVNNKRVQLTNWLK